MPAQFTFPAAPQVPATVPLYATIPPGWNTQRVAELGGRLGVRGRVTDAGPWYILHDKDTTLEVYQASQSFRLTHEAFNSEGAPDGGTPDAERAKKVAQAFFDRLDPLPAKAGELAVTELAVAVATRGSATPERRVVAVQVSTQYTLEGLLLLGPGAKAQATVNAKGQVTQAYRFWRNLKPVDTLATIAPATALDSFQQSDQFVDLPATARVEVAAIELGLLCLPPSETQGLLVPAYRLSGTVSTELLPKDGFVAYVAAAAIDPKLAKERRWLLARPTLVTA